MVLVRSSAGRKFICVIAVVALLFTAVPALTGGVAHGAAAEGLTVNGGSGSSKTYSGVELDGMTKISGTWSGRTLTDSAIQYTGVSGVPVLTLLQGAGLDTAAMNGNALVVFMGNGAKTEVSMAQLREERFYFNDKGEKVAQVQPVIAVNDGMRLLLGQTDPSEQNGVAFLDSINQIIVNGTAHGFKNSSAAPSPGAVGPGELIRLSLAAEDVLGKIYYTTDGSEPTVKSAIYNRISEQFLASGQENAPIVAPLTGTFTVKAKIMGVGGIAGPTETFSYTINQAITPSPAAQLVRAKTESKAQLDSWKTANTAQFTAADLTTLEGKIESHKKAIDAAATTGDVQIALTAALNDLGTVPTKAKHWAAVKVTAIAAKAWTGGLIKPAVVLKESTKTLKSGRDYSVSYSKNKSIGAATVTIKPLGDYSGTAKTTTFKIVPKKNAISKLSAGAGRVTVTWKKVSATQKATKYHIRYKEKSATAWKTKTVAAKNASLTIKGLTKGKTYQFQVRAVKTISKKNYIATWSAVKTSGAVK